MLGRAQAVSPSRGYAREGHEQRSHDTVLAALRGALPAAELERLLCGGANLGDLEAARLALGETEGPRGSAGQPR